jgi:hypothetical protein
MPMLPDTLGSRAFMKAAASIWVHRMENGVCRDDEAPVRLLSLMTSARQDSGSLSEFKEVICGVPAGCARACAHLIPADSGRL